MYSTGHDNGSPDGNFFGFRTEVGDDDHFTVVASQGLAKDGLADLVLCFDRANLVQEFATITIGIRIAMREIHFIIIIFECDLESECMVRPSSFFLHAILVVADIESIPDPAWCALVFCLFGGVH
jgi:hypothetical protein